MAARSSAGRAIRGISDNLPLLPSRGTGQIPPSAPSRAEAVGLWLLQIPAPICRLRTASYSPARYQPAPSPLLLRDIGSRKREPAFLRASGPPTHTEREHRL